MPPYPFLFAEVFAANIGGTATLIGDPPNIIIGSAAHLSFNDFVVNLTPIIVVIIDNGMYGTIRMHQELHYPRRISATTLKNPDFAAYAKAFGGHGELVERAADLPAAIERALSCGKPTCINVMIESTAAPVIRRA